MILPDKTRKALTTTGLLQRGSFKLSLPQRVVPALPLLTRLGVTTPVWDKEWGRVDFPPESSKTRTEHLLKRFGVAKTSYNIEAWRRRLANDPNRVQCEYIFRTIEEGTPLWYLGDRYTRIVRDRPRDAEADTALVKDVQNELDEGRMVYIENNNYTKRGSIRLLDDKSCFYGPKTSEERKETVEAY